MADEEIFLFYFNSFFFFKVKRYLDTKLGLNRKKKTQKTPCCLRQKQAMKKFQKSSFQISDFHRSLHF